MIPSSFRPRNIVVRYALVELISLYKYMYVIVQGEYLCTSGTLPGTYTGKICIVVDMYSMEVQSINGIEASNFYQGRVYGGGL